MILFLNYQSEARKLRLELMSLDETRKALLNEQRKLSSLEKEKAGDLVKLQNALIKERQIRKALVDDLNKLATIYKEILNKKETFEAFEKLSDEEIIVGKEFFKEVKRIVYDFSQIVNQKSEELNSSLSSKIIELKIQLSNWTGKEKDIQDQIDKKKQELESQGIPFDLGKINQISKDINELSIRVKKLENYQIVLKTLEADRKVLINKRQELKSKLFDLRNVFANTINANLKNTLDGLYITVKFDAGKCSEEFEKSLKSVMDWRTSQVPKAGLIVKQMNPLEFVEACKKRSIDKFSNLKDGNNNRLLNDSEINSIIYKIKNNHTFEDFEAIEYEDRPSILVTKIYIDESGKTINNTKSISQLSLGQQQSVLLGILMLSKSKKPLIIDQPEDNLDSEFIFKTIVRNLRKIKEQRQVILVTHNPNIAVLGDAELIIPLKSTSIKSHVLSSGSIDRSDTRKLCCEILEGGQSAFEQRKIIYGI
jgi:AAA domain, putative AbiEii toxin, Type IV TA system